MEVILEVILKRLLGWRLDRDQDRFELCHVCWHRPCEQEYEWRSTWLGKTTPASLAALIPLFFLRRWIKLPPLQ